MTPRKLASSRLRHSEVPRFHQRGEESRARGESQSRVGRVRRRPSRDPSLRLKNGSAQDDTPQAGQLPTASFRSPALSPARRGISQRALESESRVGRVRRRTARDPSLRLKNGSAQDDTPQARRLPDCVIPKPRAFTSGTRNLARTGQSAPADMFAGAKQALRLSRLLPNSRFGVKSP